MGYQTGQSGIDSYGVNHSGFSTQDELAYQTARQQRENQIIQNYNNQGITKNYPQYSTNFLGNNAANNYGFGTSNIENNIANMPQVTPTPTPQQASVQSQSQSVQMQPSSWHSVKNSLYSDGMDMLYGANRALNVLTYGGLDYLGNKLGIDTQMNNYLKNKQAQGLGDIAKTTGDVVQGCFGTNKYGL